MRKRRQGNSKTKHRPHQQEKDASPRSKGRSGKGEGKKTRREESSAHKSKGKSDYAILAEEILRPYKGTPIARRRPEKFGQEIEKRFWALSKEERIEARSKFKTYEQWMDSNAPGVTYENYRAPKIKIDASGKRVAKESRVKENTTAVTHDPYIVLLKPLTIVANNPEDKTVIADAGTIVQRCNSAVYRDQLSPITHRGDEWLVRYGKPDKPKYGWLSVRASDPKATAIAKKGPTFLVTTSDEASVSAWDAFRLKIGRARKADPGEWVVSWLARNGAKYPQELRALVREFGGKPIKNEGFDARCVAAFKLILKQEIDMATAKSAKRKAKKGKVKAEVETKTKNAKKTSTAKSAQPKKKESASDSDRITSKQDDYVIVRLVKENPRRAGSEKAKIWDRIKKGMTVAEFCTKGGTRGAVGRYIENGWIKLRKPGAA